jgi:hypothetical protein
MDARSIPAEEWAGFAKEFSRDHLGELVSIEVLDAERGPVHVSGSLPLMGISFDTAGTRPASVEIAAGDEDHGLLRHVVDLPMIISVSRQENQDVSLQIEPAQGPITRLLLQKEVH